MINSTGSAMGGWNTKNYATNISIKPHKLKREVDEKNKRDFVNLNVMNGKVKG